MDLLFLRVRDFPAVTLFFPGTDRRCQYVDLYFRTCYNRSGWAEKLVYYGVSGMIVSLLLIGGYFILSSSVPISSLFYWHFFMLYFCCAVSICAVVWVLLSEMYPAKIRGLAMSIAGFALWVGTYLIGQLTPWMLQTLTPSGTFFLFAIMCIPYILIIWKLIPETTGKSLEEIEQNWIK